MDGTVLDQSVLWHFGALTGVGRRGLQPSPSPYLGGSKLQTGSSVVWFFDVGIIQFESRKHLRIYSHFSRLRVKSALNPQFFRLWMFLLDRCSLPWTLSAG